MKRSVGICLLVMALALTGCASKQDVTPANYKHGDYITAAGSSIAFDALVQDLAKADYIILAENHTDVDHHAVQAQVLDALAKSGHKPTLGLEMLTKDKQGVLNQFNSKKLPLAQFSTRTDWNFAWRFTYSLYEPVIKVVHANNIPTHALNTPRSTARAVASDKAVPTSEIKWLPKRLVKGGKFDKHDLDKYRTAVIDQSVTTSDYAKKTLDEYARLRVLYEATIADAAVDIRAKSNGPMVLMVGIESLRNGNFGLVNRLREFDPSSKTVILLPTAIQNQTGFASVAQPSKQTQDALRTGAKLYYFVSLPGRVVNK